MSDFINLVVGGQKDDSYTKWGLSYLGVKADELKAVKLNGTTYDYIVAKEGLATNRLYNQAEQGAASFFKWGYVYNRFVHSLSTLYVMFTDVTTLVYKWDISLPAPKEEAANDAKVDENKDKKSEKPGMFNGLGAFYLNFLSRIANNLATAVLLPFFAVGDLLYTKLYRRMVDNDWGVLNLIYGIFNLAYDITAMPFVIAATYIDVVLSLSYDAVKLTTGWLMKPLHTLISRNNEAKGWTDEQKTKLEEHLKIINDGGKVSLKAMALSARETEEVTSNVKDLNLGEGAEVTVKDGVLDIKVIDTADASVKETVSMFNGAKVTDNNVTYNKTTKTFKEGRLTDDQETAARSLGLDTPVSVL